MVLYFIYVFLKKLQRMGQSCLEFEQIIWVTHDISFCNALITSNSQRQERKNFVFDWNCRYQNSQFVMGNNLHLQSFILPPKMCYWRKSNIQWLNTFLDIFECNLSWKRNQVRINDTGLQKGQNVKHLWLGNRFAIQCLLLLMPLLFFQVLPDWDFYGIK